MSFSWPLVVAGILVGVSVGLTGMGGGALMTPIMVMVFGVDPTAAVGSDLLASVAMKPVGAAVHHRASTVRWELVRWLVPTAVPAGFLGALGLHRFGTGPVLQHRVQLAIGAALLLAVLGMAARAVLAKRAAAVERPSQVAEGALVVRPVPTLLIGLVGGLIVGMTSVGSGSLIIVLLLLLYPRLRTSDLVGTDLVQAVPLVIAAAAGHLVAGEARLGLTGALVLGALPGIYLGAKLATKVPGGVLRWVLTVLLVGSALALWRVPDSAVVASCACLAVAGLLGTALRRLCAGPIPDAAHGRTRAAGLASRSPTAAPVTVPPEHPAGNESARPLLEEHEL